MKSVGFCFLLAAMFVWASKGQQVSTTAGNESSKAPTNSDQYLTNGLLNGRMWLQMSGPVRAFYVSAFLQGYLISCHDANGNDAQRMACYGKLGKLDHTNPVNPKEIVEGVDRIFASPENQSLIIPVAIKAASMRVNGAEQAEIDRYLDGERNALAALPKK